MKFAVTSLAFVLAAVVGTAFAAGTEPAKPMTAQQTKMSTCSKEAHTKGLKGDEYKTFMSTCLKGSSAASTAAPATAPAAAPAAAPTRSPVAPPPKVSPAKMAQRQKMKTCNAEAKTKALKGTERKAFMSTCLKGDAASAPAAH
ncbi:MAG: PsiF family protein [Rudaea sp.]